MSILRDNHKRGRVGDFLREKIQPGANLSFVSAFFTIYAYDKLRTTLDSIDHLRFLFGEPSFISNLDPSKDEAKSFEIDDAHIQLANRLEQKAIARDCATWMEHKVEIRSVTQKGFLHGKLYHIDNAGNQEAILGSSNFTVKGLGLAERPNIELNLEVPEQSGKDDLKTWFDELWNDEHLVEDVKQSVLNYLEQLYKDHDPEFIYFKTLFHLFEKYREEIRDDRRLLDVKLFDTGIWKALFEFQKDGVKGAINKILNHNGCIIADSVGLGKTFEALAVIKYFELRNQKALVLCPKKLGDNWKVFKRNDYLNPFTKDQFSYDVLYHTDLSRESGESGDLKIERINWGNYDLVVIDESHNFRNDAKGKRDEDGHVKRKSRYERLMEDIVQKGLKTKVLMLSATPVNTNLRDLRNQIYFATGGADDSFKDSMGITSLKDLIADAQRRFTIWADPKNPKKSVKELLEQLPAPFFKLLDGMTIARSRRHIERYYKKEMEIIGAFPKRLKPVALAPPIDLKKRFMSYDRLNDEIDHYELSLFNPSRFVAPEFRQLYEQKYATRGIRAFTQANRENYLIGMMKVGFMKRLESSVAAFAITMDRTIAKIDALIDRIEKFKKVRQENPDLDFDDLRPDDPDDEDLKDSFEVGKTVVFKLDHLCVDDWLKALQKDKEQLGLLYSSAVAVKPEHDAKFAELKRLIRDKITSPKTSKNGKPNKKVLLFTAFADTAKYLFDNLAEWSTTTLGAHIALVTGSGENKSTFAPRGFRQPTEFGNILANFSPVSKHRDKMEGMPQDGEIEILIATDCISEGQNLQDCDFLINYDIHWNPVRIIQRFGRIDRIGSINDEIQLVNFWPTDDLNKYINLKHRVEARMALADVAATNEDNLLSMDDLQELITEDLKYRDRQLVRLKDEILDLEDFNESVSLTEFSLDDFRMELSKYIEANKELLENAPFGLNAVVPPSKEYAQVQPGVVFCLKQKGETEQAEKVNPVQPYYLVYIRNDGEVRYSFPQTKQILELLRDLCSGKNEPYAALCRLFDAETKQGRDMERYDKLLERSVKTIAEHFRTRAGKMLSTGRDAVLVPIGQQPAAVKDFYLVTWFVITAKQ